MEEEEDYSFNDPLIKSQIENNYIFIENIKLNIGIGTQNMLVSFKVHKRRCQEQNVRQNKQKLTNLHLVHAQYPSSSYHDVFLDYSRIYYLYHMFPKFSFLILVQTIDHNVDYVRVPIWF